LMSLMVSTLSESNILAEGFISRVEATSFLCKKLTAFSRSSSPLHLSSSEY